MHRKEGSKGYAALLGDGEVMCRFYYNVHQYTKSLTVAKDCLAIRKSGQVENTTEDMIRLLDILADSLERTGEVGKAVQVRQRRTRLLHGADLFSLLCTARNIQFIII